MYPDDFVGKYVVEHYRRKCSDSTFHMLHGMVYTLDEFFIPELGICINSKAAFPCKKYELDGDDGAEFVGKTVVLLSDFEDHIRLITQFHDMLTAYEKAKKDLFSELDKSFSPNDASSAPCECNIS